MFIIFVTFAVSKSEGKVTKKRER